MIDILEVGHDIGDAHYTVVCEMYSEPYGREALVIEICAANGEPIPPQDWEAHAFDDDELDKAAKHAMDEFWRESRD
jgi:hypothetical protein